MRKVSAKNKGFTLLELVISLALIAILIIPISNLVLGSVKINKAGEDKQQAGLKLQEVIENIKSVDLPKSGSLDIGNGVKIEKNENGTFSISDSNDNDIKIEGTIEKTVLTGETANSIGDTEITGTVYYDGTSQKIAISEYGSNKKLSEAVENIDTAVTRSVKDMILKISKINNGNIEVTWVDKNDEVIVGENPEYLKRKNNNSDNILLYLNNDEVEKLDLKLKSVEGKELNVCLFENSGIASRDDITLLSLEGNVNIIGGLTKKNISNLVTYEVQLSAIKGEKQLESTSFTMVK